MLTAILEVPIGDMHHVVGPEPFFKAEGETLKTPSGEHVAVHRAGLWVIGNASYIAVSFHDPVVLSFDDPASGGHAEYGPFPHMRIVNGSIWVKAGGKVELLAHFDDMTGLWTVHPAAPLKAANLTIRAPV
jgi:hypothetical protein